MRDPVLVDGPYCFCNVCGLIDLGLVCIIDESWLAWGIKDHKYAGSHTLAFAEFSVHVRMCHQLRSNNPICVLSCEGHEDIVIV